MVNINDNKACVYSYMFILWQVYLPDIKVVLQQSMLYNEYSSQCSVNTSNDCNYGGYTYVVTCILLQVADQALSVTTMDNGIRLKSMYLTKKKTTTHN